MTEAGRVQRTNGEVETSSTNEWSWFINERVNERVGYFFEKSTTFFYTPFVHNHTPFAVQVFETDYKLLVPVTGSCQKAQENQVASYFEVSIHISVFLNGDSTRRNRMSSKSNISDSALLVPLYTVSNVTRE